MAKHRAPYDLTAYLLNELPEEQRRAVEGHLQTCLDCREEVARLSEVVEQMRALPVAPAPATAWEGISGRLARPARKSPARRWVLVGSLAAALAVTYFLLPNRQVRGQTLIVEALYGTPSINGQAAQKGTVSEDGWVRTDGRSAARVHLPKIGSLDIQPGSRLRVVSSGIKSRRFALEVGAIQVKVTAPPRLLVVETPTTTAVDLGCAYELKVEPSGETWIRVTQGWVTFEGKDYSAYIASGMVCRTQPVGGPGVPYYERAPQPLQDEVENLDAGRSFDLKLLLTQARPEDALTLWHLLWKTSGKQREEVYARLAALAPPPPGVTRNAALALDTKPLEVWRTDFAPLDDFDFWR